MEPDPIQDALDSLEHDWGYTSEELYDIECHIKHIIDLYNMDASVGQIIDDRLDKFQQKCDEDNPVVKLNKYLNK